MKKILATIAVLTMVFMTATPLQTVQAQTTNQSASGLQAQINNLLALISQLQAQLAQKGGSSGTTSGFTFTSNLTVGSRGNEVTELQQFLVSKGYLAMPAGVGFGYFGVITRDALAKWQSSQGISPTAGYFGPLTRTKINAIISSANPGTTTPGTGITTPGAEGDMSVTSNNAGLVSTLYEGDNMVPVLGIKISAKSSDLDVQRVKVNLGNSSTLYNKVLSTLYVTNGSDTLASVDLDSSTVTKDGGNYYITITGFHFIVPENTSKTLVIKADVRSSVDSKYRSTQLNIKLADGGVRAIDGAGIDHYAPEDGGSIARNTIVQQSLAESATLRISVDRNTPKTQEVVANEGANNDELDRLSLLAFDLKASRDDVTLTDLEVDVSKTGTGGADISTVYLYDGSNEIDNASVTNGTATFSNLSYTIPRDSTKVLTVKTDITNADSNAADFIVSIPRDSIVAENSLGDEITDITGSATGYQIGVRNVGSEVALLSKSVTTSGVPQGGGANPMSTSAMTANFNVRITATGGDLILGTPASDTPAFDYNSFVVYQNGIADNSLSPSAVSFSVPSGANTSGLTNSFRIPEGTTVTIPVTVQLLGRVSGQALDLGLYSVSLDNMSWSADGLNQNINFMAGDPDWRTNEVSFP
jgi:hypothetical protein